MSQWTHVAGVIRIDGMPSLVGLNQEQERAEIQRMIGNTCGSYDDASKWDACNVPCGSEGSLQYGYSFYGHDEVVSGFLASSSLSRGAITIWGDLRDYDDENEIIEWFKGIMAKFQPKHPENKGNFGIRDALLSIRVEGRGKKVCVWNDDKEEIEILSYIIDDKCVMVDKEKRLPNNPYSDFLGHLKDENADTDSCELAYAKAQKDMIEAGWQPVKPIDKL